MTNVPCDELSRICQRALAGAGADLQSAQILAEATVEAEMVGNRAVGVAHLFDYLDGYRTGRIAANVSPQINRPALGVIDADASNGLAQTAFQSALAELLAATREAGIAALWIRRSFTCGELGYYVRRLAHEGFIAMASANSPALMSIGGSPGSVLGTNPLAYGIPRGDKPPIVIDQASSSTAYVNIKRAAEKDEPIPAGWALGPDGRQTQSAQAALMGTLLPFGGHRGGNVALLMEVLATLSGGSFSINAAPFDHGAVSPGIGVFVLSIDPSKFSGSADRVAQHLEFLRDEHQVRLPSLEFTALPENVEIDSDILLRLRAEAEPAVARISANQ